MRMKRREKLGLRHISEFELMGIRFEELGEELVKRRELERKLEELKK